MSVLRRWWRGLRAWLAWLNGDTAYRAHCAAWRRGAAATPGCRHGPPSRGAFYRAELERRWSGVRRCC